MTITDPTAGERDEEPGDKSETCVVCTGTGQMFAKICPLCDGHGQVTEEFDDESESTRAGSECDTVQMFVPEEEDDPYTLAPMNCNAAEQYTAFTMVMDSGASDPVISAKTIPQIPVRPSPGSLKGQTYAAAGGKGIPNEGEHELPR